MAVDPKLVALARSHLFATVVVAAALAVVASIFVFARPEYRRSVQPPPPHEPLPYTKALYSASRAQQAFGAAGVTLVRRIPASISTDQPPIIDLSSRRDIVIVDVFGNRDRVAASGFSDYFTFDAKGSLVKAPRQCSPGVTNAERWHGNVRVIVSCARAGASAPLWLARVKRAFAQLS